MAWSIMRAIEQLDRELAKNGKPHSGRWGTRGTTGPEQALSGAMWMAWRSMQRVGAWLYWDDHEHPDYKGFVEAANVMRGGSRHESPGHWYDIAVGAMSAFMTTPRPSADEFAAETPAVLASVFGHAFAELSRSTVERLYTATWTVIDQAAEKANALVRTGAPASLAPHQFYDEQEKAIIRLTKTLVWLAYEGARDAGKLDDPGWFSFPMPGRETRKGGATEPTKEALHRAFLNQKKQDQKRSRDILRARAERQG
jgi:hypothetical protein